MDKTRIDFYKALFRDTFNWLMANAPCDNMDGDFFKNRVDEMNVLYNKFGNDPLAMSMLTAVYSEFDRIGAEQVRKRADG